MAASFLPFRFVRWAEMRPGPVGTVMEREDIRALW